ncbi:MAG: hypothetical protein RSH79_08040 [Clostridiales bacterium]
MGIVNEDEIREASTYKTTATVGKINNTNKNQNSHLFFNIQGNIFSKIKHTNTTILVINNKLNRERGI